MYSYINIVTACSAHNYGTRTLIAKERHRRPEKETERQRYRQTDVQTDRQTDT